MQPIPALLVAPTRPLRRPAPLASVALGLLSGLLSVVLTGCPTASTGTPSPDAGPEAEGECPQLTIGPVGLDVQQDVQTIYSAVIDQDLGSAVVDDFLVFQFVNYNERFGLAAIGTFPLDEAPNDNRGPCAECISIFVDQQTPNAAPAKVLFQTAGSITLTENPREQKFVGTVTDLELREVTIDGETLESTLVEGGDCYRIATFDVEVRAVPDGWTCDAALYDSGGLCNCSCGVYDPDCSCDFFAGEDCSQPIEDDCGVSEVCTTDGCAASCDMFSSTTDCPGGICQHGDNFTVCSEEVPQTDPAVLGAACAGPQASFEAIYCDITGSVAAGMCDDTTGLCAPICDNDSRCADGQFCVILATTGGYCRQGPPPEWFNCDGSLWNDGATCDCGCGIADPDCADDTLPVAGCGEGGVCFDGICDG